MTEVRGPLAVAHRGYSAAFPENTPEGARAALGAGADFVEMDVRLGRDGVAVASHDPDLLRLAGNVAVIAETDWGDLSRIPLIDGRRLSPIREILDALPPTANVLFDVKIGGRGVIEAALGCWEARKRSGFLIVGVRETAQIAWLGDYPALALIPALEDAAAFLSAGARAIRVWESDIERPESRALIEGGVEIWVTAGRTRPGETAGDITRFRFRRLRELGVAAVLLNDPTLAKEE